MLNLFRICVCVGWEGCQTNLNQKKKKTINLGELRIIIIIDAFWPLSAFDLCFSLTFYFFLNLSLSFGFIVVLLYHPTNTHTHEQSFYGMVEWFSSFAILQFISLSLSPVFFIQFGVCWTKKKKKIAEEEEEVANNIQKSKKDHIIISCCIIFIL